MLHLSSYLEPINPTLLEGLINPNLAGLQIKAYTGLDFPVIDAATVCLVGLPDVMMIDYLSSESEQTQAWESIVYSADKIRYNLYRLFKWEHTANLVDLGNVRPGPSEQQTSERLALIAEWVSQAGAVLLLIGPDQTSTLHQIEAYTRHHNKERQLSLAIIDAKLDMDYVPTKPLLHNYLNKLFLLGPQPVYDFSLIGYQQYLTDPGHIAFMEQASFNLLRLGVLRSDFSQSEALLRQAHVVSFDINVVKSSELPGSLHPFGLTAEETAQLFWYAGHNPLLTSFGVYGYSQAKDLEGRAAQLLAVSIWYLIDGIGKWRLQAQQLNQYRVDASGYEDLVFAEDRLHQRWWIGVADQEVNNLADFTYCFSCKTTDYEEVMNGAVPLGLMRIMSRLSNLTK